MFRIERFPQKLTKFFAPLEGHFHWNRFGYFRNVVLAITLAWGRRNVANLYRCLEAKTHRTRYNNYRRLDRWDPPEALRQKAMETLGSMRPRRGETDDITDLVKMLFPRNGNQQHAAARIILALKASDEPLASLSLLEREHGISRRTLQRTRAKLARVGPIEYASPLSARYGGRAGWRLSGRMSTALRQLADKLDACKRDSRPEHRTKDEQLISLLRP